MSISADQALPSGLASCVPGPVRHADKSPNCQCCRRGPIGQCPCPSADTASPPRWGGDAAGRSVREALVGPLRHRRARYCQQGAEEPAPWSSPGQAGPPPPPPPPRVPHAQPSVHLSQPPPAWGSRKPTRPGGALPTAAEKARERETGLNSSGRGAGGCATCVGLTERRTRPS